MGERYHCIVVCEPRLVAELSTVASEAVLRRDGSGLRAFLGRHEDRVALIDGHRVPLDVAALAKARKALAPVVRELNEVSLAARDVAENAQSSLLNRATRVARMLEISAPRDVLETELAYVRAAIAALDSADLTAREARAGLRREPWDGELVARCLDLCVVPGERDLGLGDAWSLRMEPFIEGPPLVAMPTISEDEEPSAELLGRVVERFGVYTSGQAREILFEDWLRFCQSFTGYSPPTWAEGDALTGAASSIREARGRRVRTLARELDRVASAGHAVVEWVEKV